MSKQKWGKGRDGKTRVHTPQEWGPVRPPAPVGSRQRSVASPSLSESMGVTGTHTSLSIFVSASFSKTAP